MRKTRPPLVLLVLIELFLCGIVFVAAASLLATGARVLGRLVSAHLGAVLP